MKRVLESLVVHIGGARGGLPQRTFARLHKQLLSGNKKTETFGNCILFCPDEREDTMILGRALPSRDFQKYWEPISVGETIHWDGRWRITLKEADLSVRNPRRVTKREQLYVRHMNVADYPVAQRGIRRVRTSTLPHVKIRTGLPVVCTESGYVVLAPHFMVTDYSYGVYCELTFDPLMPLIQDSDIHVC